MLNIPNTLTLLRIAAIPAILIALDAQRTDLALVLFVAAGFTDGLDGAIARLTNSKTELGAFLDPLADKGLVLVLLIKLTLLGLVEGWVLTIILTRDIVCISGYMILYFLTGEAIPIRPSLAGKLATFIQLLGVAGGLLCLWRPTILPTEVTALIFAVAAGVTALAGIQYVARGLRWYQERPA